MAARGVFGKLTRAQERFYEAGRWRWWEHLIADLRQAFRIYIKRAGFTLAVLATLALGVGANAALFTVVNTVLLHPLPYPDAGRIVNITRRGGGSDSVPMFTYWQQNNPLFEDPRAYSFMGSGVNLSGGDRPELVQALNVSRDYFRLFGTNPLHGRTFTAEEDQPGGAQVLVVSYGLWQKHFGGDPTVLGKAITLGGAPYTLVGILSSVVSSRRCLDAVAGRFE